jgi:hypothetical protein
LSHFLLPNKYGNYKLEGRKATFNSDKNGETRSLIFKEGISDGVLEVFVFLLLFIFIFFLNSKIKYEIENGFGGFIFLIILLIIVLLIFFF